MSFFLYTFFLTQSLVVFPKKKDDEECYSNRTWSNARLWLNGTTMTSPEFIETILFWVYYTINSNRVENVCDVQILMLWIFSILFTFGFYRKSFSIHTRFIVCLRFYACIFFISLSLLSLFLVIYRITIVSMKCFSAVASVICCFGLFRRILNRTVCLVHFMVGIWMCGERKKKSDKITL